MIRVFAGLLVLVLLALPLRDILTHPTRLSVLPSLQVDAAAYDTIAAEVARTRSLDAIPPLQPPGFVLTMALVFAVAGHSWVVAKVFLWLMLVACVACGARLAWRVYGDELHAWTSAVLIAAAPALHGYVGTIQYEVVAAAALLVLLLAAHRAANRSIVACVLLGLAAGAATLTREVFVVILPVLAAYVAQRQWSRSGARRALASAAIICLCAAVPIAAWGVLQTERAGRVVPISDKGSLVMEFGNNPYANGTFNAPLVGVGQPAGLAFVRAEPRRFLQLSGRKFLYFWGVLRDGWNVPRVAALWLSRGVGGAVALESILPIVRGGWILAAVVLALIAWRRSTWTAWWVLPISIAAVLCVHLITVSSHRFAVPVLPVAFVIAAGPVAAIFRWIVASRVRRATSLAAVFAIVAMQHGNWPLRYTLSAAQMDGLNAGNANEPGIGEVRVADAARGARAAVLLADEALPRGHFVVDLRARRMTHGAGAPIARLWLQTTEGTRVCEMAIEPAQLPVATWTTVRLPCSLEEDAVITTVVMTTGVADLAIESLAFRW